MPQIVKQRGWAKPNQLPAGPREKRPIGRLFSSSLICHKVIIFTDIVNKLAEIGVSEVN